MLAVLTQEPSMNEAVRDVALASIQALWGRGKRRGFVTYGELNKAVPPGSLYHCQIDDIIDLIEEMGVRLIEAEDGSGEDDDPVGGGPSSPKGPPPLPAEAARDHRERAEGSREAAPEPVRVMHDNKPSVVAVEALEWEHLKRRTKNA